MEELLVALADALWKGKRQTELETLVIEQVALRSGGDYWTVFMALDSCFEAIAADGQQRLWRSQAINERYSYLQ
ncbi:MAG: hypothetical protein AAGG51_27630 [Cyanobacteria bacterium P01_G01_bin.54]